MNKPKPVYLSPGVLSSAIAACRFAVEQHTALAALTVGDERIMHQNAVASAQYACDELAPIDNDARSFSGGSWEVTWRPGVVSSSNDKGEEKA